MLSWRQTEEELLQLFKLFPSLGHLREAPLVELAIDQCHTKVADMVSASVVAIQQQHLQFVHNKLMFLALELELELLLLLLFWPLA